MERGINPNDVETVSPYYHTPLIKETISKF